MCISRQTGANGEGTGYYGNLWENIPSSVYGCDVKEMCRWNKRHS